MQMPTFSAAQLNAVLRHGGTVAATTVTVFTTLGMLSPEDSAKLITNLHSLVDGLQQAVGAFYGIIAIVGPIAIGLFAKFAAASASITGQLKSVTSNPQVKIDPGAIQAPAEIANAVPNDKVVPLENPK